MLSYQHIYHAGCLADVHKHSILSVVLAHLILKDKPLTYMETHAGRGLYDLNAPEAQKTGEAKLGIESVMGKKVFPENHPYIEAINYVKECYGEKIYPGSPMLAHYFLRPVDQIYLMELHPQEISYLRKNITATNAHIHHRNGYEGVLALSPPTLRRGIVFIDPSYEIKEEYQDVVKFIQKLHQKWAEATIAIWYPMLKTNHYQIMKDRLIELNFKNAFLNEIQFSNALNTKGIYGSGIFFINCPFGVEQAINECSMFMAPFEMN